MLLSLALAAPASAAWALLDENATPAAKAFLKKEGPTLAQAGIQRMNKTGDGLANYRQVLSSAELAFRGDPASMADVFMDLGEEEVASGDGGQGVQWRLQSVPLYREAYGLRDRHVVQAFDKHICLLVCDEAALPSLRQTVADLAQAADAADRLRLLTDLGVSENALGLPTEGEATFRKALALEATHPDLATASSYAGLSLSLQAQGRMAEATDALQAALTLDRRASAGRSDVKVVSDEQALANAYAARGMFDAANSLYADVLAHLAELRRPVLGGPGDMLARDDWGVLLMRERRYGEAETVFRMLIEEQHLESGPVNAGNDAFDGKIQPLIHAAQNLLAQGKLDAAKAEFRIGAARADPYGGQDPFAAEAYSGLADVAQRQGDDRTLHAAAEKALAELGPMVRQPLPENQILAGRLLRLAGHPSEAARHLEETCKDPIRVDILDLAPLRRPDCNLELALTLWDRSATTRASSELSDMEPAFVASQRAIQSSAGDAMARAAAIAAASLHGDAALAGRYETAVSERDTVAASLGQASADSSAAGMRRQQGLQKQLSIADEEVARVGTLLREREPRYWELRSPSPASFAELAETTSAGAPLLHSNEALVLLLAPVGPERGLVFVVSQSGNAWARLGLRGDDLDATVRTLRSQIDPHAYGSKDQNADAHPLDRRLAHKLFTALLGAPSLSPVLAKADTLLIVASGPLLSLPPGLLVTRAPEGEDSEPKARRATAWLLREKAIAILPTVASLRLLRRSSGHATNAAALPLRGLADPDFSKMTEPTVGRITDAKVERRMVPVQDLYRDGVVDPFKLADFPPLPAARVEGQALEVELNAPGSILYGRDASKAKLVAEDKDGTLARVKVLEFATHAIVAGDISGLAQPALVLARPKTIGPEDNGLLTAPEAALLTLNADWVILSACNTASPQGGSAEGLSGLARSFLYAGARSVLASHWEILDTAGEQVIASLFNPASHDLSKAHALQRAELQVLDDTTYAENSDPFSWAPFVLIGDPDA